MIHNYINIKDARIRLGKLGTRIILSQSIANYKALNSIETERLQSSFIFYHKFRTNFTLSNVKIPQKQFTYHTSRNVLRICSLKRCIEKHQKPFALLTKVGRLLLVFSYPTIHDILQTGAHDFPSQNRTKAILVYISMYVSVHICHKGLVLDQPVVQEEATIG